MPSLLPDISAPTAAPTATPSVLRIGFLALTDAAPFVVAQELGYFKRRGLRVDLRREIGWATIREKIIYGELDVAHAPAPMLWSAQLGHGCPACDVLTAFVLNLNGNAITLSTALWAAGVRDAASLKGIARERRAKQPLTFGVVFPFSSHHIILRDWLMTASLEADRDVRIVVVPPAQMFRNLAAGTIDGYCVGEPWNSFAVREGAGWCPTWSAAQQPGHVEKVVMVTRRFAETRAIEHAALIASLNDAAVWCDEPQNRERLADMLAEARYLNLPSRVVASSLVGKFDCGQGRIEHVPDFHVFHRGEANVPVAAKAVVLQAELRAAGLITAQEAADAELPRKLFREDLHRNALQHHPLHVHTTS